MRIIYTSCSPTMRAVLRNMLLRLKDAEIESAANPEDTAATAVALKPDLIIFDESGGGEETGRLADLLRTQRLATRMLVLAGPGVDESRMPDGVDMMHKPFTPEQLMDHVMRGEARV